MKNKPSEPNILGKKDITIMQPTAWDYGGFHSKAGYFNKTIISKKTFSPVNTHTEPQTSPVKKEIMEEINRNKQFKKYEEEKSKEMYGGIPQATLQIFDIIARAQARQLFEKSREPNDLNDSNQEPMDFSKAYTYDEWIQIKRIEEKIKQQFIIETLQAQNESEKNQEEQIEALQKEKEQALRKWEEEKIIQIFEKKHKEKVKTMQKQAETIRKMNEAQEAFEKWRKNDELNRKLVEEEKNKKLQEEKEKRDKEEAKKEQRKKEALHEYNNWKEKKDDILRSTVIKSEAKKENKFPYSIHDIFNVPAKTISKKLRKRKQKRRKKKIHMIKPEIIEHKTEANQQPAKVLVKAKNRRDQVDENIHIFDEISSIRRIGDNSESGILFPNKNQLEKVEEDIHNTSI